VVAPVPGRDGAVVRRVGDRFTMALYPHVDGRVHEWGGYSSLADRLAVLDRVIAVHAAPEEVRELAPVDDFTVQERDELERALDDVSGPWDGGPYAERTRTLLAGRAAGVERELRRYDELVRGALARPERAVLTHGEPHVGNTIRTDAGWVLIDWDTTLVAPPERDLWMLTDDDGRVVEVYAATTGSPVLPTVLEQYRLAWELTEIALYVARFRRPHAENDDTAVAWTVVERILTRLDSG
jgi:spectinomycin phosphotransferase/16S rRNA (guanine(1405)-N(7))-methyltransferase